MTNLEVLQKLSLGTDDTEEVIIEYDGAEVTLTLRPLTAGELTQLQAVEKKSLKVSVGMKNGKRQNVTTNLNDIDINTGEFTKDQTEAMYNAIALSLSVDGEIVTVDDIKQMRTGLPEIIFEQVIRVSKLSDEDLTIIKSFRKNK